MMSSRGLGDPLELGRSTVDLGRSTVERQRYLRQLSALGLGIRHDLGPRFGVGREHAVIPQHMEARWRDQGT